MDQGSDQDVQPGTSQHKSSQKTINEPAEEQDEEYEAVDESLKNTKMSRDQKVAFQKSMTNWDHMFSNMVEERDKALEDRIPVGKKK